METEIGKIRDNIGKDVTIHGWVHRIRRQGKKMIFLILRDGSGFVQVGLFGELAKTFNEPQSLCLECYIKIQGLVKEDSRAPYAGVEVEAREIIVFKPMQEIKLYLTCVIFLSVEKIQALFLKFAHLF